MENFGIFLAHNFLFIFFWGQTITKIQQQQKITLT